MALATPIMMATPAPSSIAPTPGSQESRCAPRITISLARSVPGISPTTLADRAGGRSRELLFRCAVARVCRSRTGARAHRHRDSKSRAPGFAACRRRIAVAPVCGKRLLLVLTERMTTPTAPSAAAADGPTRANRDGLAVSGAVARAFHAIAEEHDLVLHRAGGQRGQRGEILHHDRVGFDAFASRADAAARARGPAWSADRAQAPRIRPRRGPSEARSPGRYARSRIPAAAFRAGPRPRRPCRRRDPAGRGPTSVVSDSTSW